MVSVCVSSTCIGFSPLHIDKDVVVLCMLVLIGLGLLLLQVFSLSLGSNGCAADAMLTPAWVVPEWYFLAVYCVLRLV